MQMARVEAARRQAADANHDAQRTVALLELDLAMGLLTGGRCEAYDGRVPVLALAGMTVGRMTLVRGGDCRERRSTCHGCERDDETAVSHASPSLGNGTGRTRTDERELLHSL